MGTSHTVLPVISLRPYLPSDVKIPANPNDSYRHVHLFRNFLEFLSIRIQMCSYLQNNIDKLLHSCTILRNHRTNLLDYRTCDV